MLGEQSPRDFLWKPFSFFWIADRPSVLFLGVSLDEKRHPSLKADRGKAWNVWFLIVLFLDEVVMTSKVSIHSGN